MTPKVGGSPAAAQVALDEEPVSPADVVIALGANLGDRLATLQSAVSALATFEGVKLGAVSAVFETAPAGGPPDQPDYLNAVVVLTTTRDAVALLALAHDLEAAAGRVRLERWGPRTLDVDVIDVDGEVSPDPVLTLPHPRAHERAFVLVPWHDVDPEAVLAGHGPVTDLLSGVADQQVRRTDQVLVVR